MRSVIFLYICNQKFYVLLNMVYLKESVVLKAKMKARIIAATNQNLEHMIVEKV